jgi:multiple sugar transport system permease protein
MRVGTDRAPAATPTAGARPAVGERRRWASRRWVRRAAVPYLFLAPFLLLFCAFLVVPLAYALGISMFVERLIGGATFVGARNYLRAFTDPSFLESVRRMALFGIVQVPVMLGLALLLALLLDGGLVYLRRLFRLTFFLPYAVPSVVAALMWAYVYSRDFGPLSQIAQWLGFGAPDFLGPRAMLASLGNVVTWEYTGYNLLILYAALQSVPSELYDAAAVDGASRWQVAWRIKMPLIAPALVLAGVFSIIGTLQLFNEPYVMQPLTPMVIGSHYTPNLYAYTLAFTNQQYNYSAAVSFTLGAVVFVASYLFLFITGRWRRAR